MGIFAKLKAAWLAPMSFESLGEEFYDELEENLILGDVGTTVAAGAVDALRRRA